MKGAAAYVAIALFPFLTILIQLALEQDESFASFQSPLTSGILVTRFDTNASKHLYPYLAAFIVVAIIIAITGIIVVKGASLAA